MALLQENLSDKLNRLFASQAVVRKVGKKKLKVIDASRIQFQGNKSLGRVGYQGVYVSGRNMGGTYGGASTAESQLYFRHRLFADYEQMDMDSIISGILDIFADETTLENEFGETITIKTENQEIKVILENLFYDILNIDFNLWSWVRTMVKYGDCFLKIDISEDVGVINVTPLSVYELTREEGYDPEQPFSARFKYTPMNAGSMMVAQRTDMYFDYAEVLHFRMIGDQNYLPYGRSALEPARKDWKRLTMTEDAMMLMRIMRAPERRVWHVDVGNLDPAAVDPYMQKIIAQHRKTPHIDPVTGEYNLRFNLENMLEDYWLPNRGGDSPVSVEPLPGMENTTIEDVEYFKNRMLTAFKVPKAFIGFEEGVEGKCIDPNTRIPLLNGDVKTAKELIEDYQNGIRNYVYSIDPSDLSVKAGLIEWAGYTRTNTKVMKVTLDNDEFITCTPDHKFMLRDGTFQEAQNLTEGQSLMPYYTQDGGYKNGYTTIYNPKHDKFELVHRLVPVHIPSGKVVHHKDFNKRNNDPENLDTTMSFFEHSKYHSDLCNSTLNSPENLAKRTLLHRSTNHFSIQGKKGGAISGAKLAAWVKQHGPANKKVHPTCTCIVCGTEFTTHAYRGDTAKYCTPEHQHIGMTLHLGEKYNSKYDKITQDELILAGKESNTLKQLTNVLGITWNTLYRILNRFGFTTSSFVESHMPNASKNSKVQVLNHKVKSIEFLDLPMDTCDLTISTYHNFATEAGVFIHNSTLAQQDVRFARTISRFQQIIVSELRRIATIHLFAQGYRGKEMEDFDLSLTGPSIIYQQEKLQFLRDKIDLAEAAKGILPLDWIYSEVFEFSDFEQAKIRRGLVNDAKNEYRITNITENGDDPASTKNSTEDEIEMRDEEAEIAAMFDDSDDEEPEEEQPKKKASSNSKPKDTASIPGGDEMRSDLKHNFQGGSPNALEK